MFLSFSMCEETCCKTSARSACSRSGRCPLPLLRACLCPADGSFALCSHSHKEASGLTVNLQQMDEQRLINHTQEQLRVFLFSSQWDLFAKLRTTSTRSLTDIHTNLTFSHFNQVGILGDGLKNLILINIISNFCHGFLCSWFYSNGHQKRRQLVFKSPMSASFCKGLSLTNYLIQVCWSMDSSKTCRAVSFKDWSCRRVPYPTHLNQMDEFPHQHVIPLQVC